MLLKSLRWRSIGPLKGEGALDLTTLPRLVAVVGPNGAGKSHLLGLFPAALERAMPDADPNREGRSLVSLATARDSYVQVDLVAGVGYSIRHLVDGISGKSEAVLLDEVGVPVLPTTKVTLFDEWRLAHLPQRAVLLTSIYAAQGSGGFLDLTPGDRKGIILRTLGLERYERLAEEARARREAAKGRGVGLEADVARERPHADVAAALEALDLEEVAHGGARIALTATRLALEDRRAAHAAALSAAREGEAAAKRHREARQRAEGARLRVHAAKCRVDAEEVLLADRDAIERAVRRVAELAASIGEATAAARAEEEAAKGADAEAHAAGREEASASARHRQAEERIAQARRRLGARAKIAEAVITLPALREAAAAAAANLKRSEAELERLQGTHLSGKDERIAWLRAGLRTIAHEVQTLEDARVEASADLAADDTAIQAAAAHPAALKAARDALTVDRDLVDKTDRLVREAEPLAARAPDMEAASTEEALACHDADEAASQAGEAATRKAAAEKRARDHRTCAAAFEEHVTAWTRERRGLADIAAKAPALAAAAVRLEELRPAVAAAEAEVLAAEEALAAAPDPGVVPAVPDLAAEERAVKAAEEALQAAAGAVGQAQARLDAAEAAAARLAAAEKALEEAREETGDWNRIAEDLGRNGIQALLIDAAGPELTVVVNDLLREAFGPRYTVTLETTRPRAQDGAPMEVFDLRVLDTGNGWEGSVDGLSGGQRVIVGEALRLALTTLAARRSGVRDCTLVRDEAGAALDTEAGPAWIAMLRRAADLVGARQVLVVTHDPAVAALCDARILVRDGRVEVLA